MTSLIDRTFKEVNDRSWTGSSRRASDPTSTEVTGPYNFHTRGWSAALHRARLRMLLRILKAYGFSRGSYADVGCGNGYATAQIMRAIRAPSCDGFDLDPMLLESGRRHHPEIRFSLFDLNRPPHGALPCYDFVTCFETLEHVGNPAFALNNLLALTKAGGYLFISVPIEVGVIGLAKFAVKVALRGDRLTEAFAPQPHLHRRYFRTLLLDQGIQTFREGSDRAYWPGHWGFDWRIIDRLLQDRGVWFKGFRFLTTRLYEVRPQGRK
jgi:2-polyprenyl-3-methyl-5-hydroxy-6-metoxy-1,4-benzoquinol methylase